MRPTQIAEDRADYAQQEEPVMMQMIVHPTLVLQISVGLHHVMTELKMAKKQM